MFNIHWLVASLYIAFDSAHPIFAQWARNSLIYKYQAQAVIKMPTFWGIVHFIKDNMPMDECISWPSSHLL